jgi:hypothetical protein
VQGKGRVAAKKLKLNDKLELQNGEDAFVDAIRREKLDQPIQVFNFEVEDFHTYFVGAGCVLVHNMCQTMKGSNNPKVAEAAKNGRKMHSNWDYGPGVKKEKTIKGLLDGKQVTRRIDGYDKTNQILYELKPNNPRAISRGWKQLDNYEKILGGTWTKVLLLH